MDSNRPFGMKRPRALERRSAERDDLGIAISLHSTTQSRVAFMGDVSRSGARVAGQDLPAVGKDVLLKIADVELFGSIIRASEGEAAIKFDRPIGATELERLRAVFDEQTREATLHSM